MSSVVVGLSGMAQYDCQGNKAAEPRFPFRVIFHPAKHLHEAFPDTYPNMPYYEQLSTFIKSGTSLWPSPREGIPEYDL